MVQGEAVGLTPLESKFPGIHVPRELVAAARLEMLPPNRLLEGEVYEKVGDSGTIAADPPAIHFAGFETGEVLTRVVRLVTTTTRPQRVHVHAPDTAYFSSYCEKRGEIVPGLFQEVLVTFRPDELRYYADCLRVHCSGHNLLVPIHAYPAMGEARIPPAIDFGVCEPGTRVERLLPLRAPAAAAFEFSVEVLQPHPAIDVAPLSGLVPAGGEALICVGYMPSALVSAHGRFRLSLSQFGSTPAEVRVTGAAGPGVALRREAERIEATHGRSRPQMVRALAEHMLAASGELEATLRLEASERGEGGEAREGGGEGDPDESGGGAGGPIDAPPRRAAPRGFRDHVRGDAVTVARAYAIREAVRSSGRPLELRLNSPPRPRPDVRMEGLSIPADMRQSGAAVYILNQVPGKLKVRELKAVIDAQRREAEQRQQEEAALAARRGAAGAGGVGAEAKAGADVDEGAFDLALSTAQRQAKSVLFSRELARIAEAEKAKEVRSHVSPGLDLMAEGAAQATRAARERRARANATARLERQLTRTAPELSAEKPLRLLPPGPAPDGAPAPSAEACSGLGLSAPEYAPQFDRYQNAMGERARTLEQGKQAILAIVAARRLQRRVEKIEAALAARVQAGGGGAAADGGAGAPPAAWPHPALAKLLRVAPPRLESRHIGTPELPRALDDPLERARAEMPTPLRPIERLTLFPLRVARPHEEDGHGAFSAADVPVGSYAPVETERPLRTGAADEYGAPLPAGEPLGGAGAEEAAAAGAARPGAREMPETMVSPADAVWGCGALAAAEAAKLEHIAELQASAARRAKAEQAARDAPKSRAGARADADAAGAALGGGEGAAAELDGAPAAEAAPTEEALAEAAAAAAAAAAAEADAAVGAALQLPLRPLAYAQGPQFTELDPDYVLQPGTFAQAAFVDREELGTGSVRALASEPTLSGRWSQALAPWAEADPQLLPMLLTGPSEEDLEVRRRATSAAVPCACAPRLRCSALATASTPPLPARAICSLLPRLPRARRPSRSPRPHPRCCASTLPSRRSTTAGGRCCPRAPARRVRRASARPSLRARLPLTLSSRRLLRR